jgi:hypothetical protein
MKRPLVPAPAVAKSSPSAGARRSRHLDLVMDHRHVARVAEPEPDRDAGDQVSSGRAVGWRGYVSVSVQRAIAASL